MESGLTGAVRSLYDDLEDSPYATEAGLRELFTACLSTLGPHHWATVHCHAMLAEVWAAQLITHRALDRVPLLRTAVDHLLATNRRWVASPFLGGVVGEYYRPELLSGTLALTAAGHGADAVAGLECCAAASLVFDPDDRSAALLRCLEALRGGHVAEAQHEATGLMAEVLGLSAPPLSFPPPPPPSPPCPYACLLTVSRFVAQYCPPDAP
eukprot:TRINITY_DN16197_c0_g1_i1.p1 TRINITY_DN16197_c0_g1~~TRINITY_DN16197_c0_g1_i1.p1  ORF type:complete len:211 (+),score=57.17 TRINITY_DN16197_c0_g1_i1:352-984(+)